MESYDIVIIGAGPAGYTAAIYAARAGRSSAIITGLQPGGQLMTTTDVENYPGFSKTIQGPFLMQEMSQQAEHAGAKLIQDSVIEVNLKQPPFTLKTDSGQHYQAKSVIIATGARAKWLNLPVEEKFKGFGVSGCATCDGFFYKNQPVMVIGGGNTALEEALFLSQICSSVTLVHRRKEFKAEQVLIDRVKKNSKIQIIWQHELIDIKGEKLPDGAELVAGAVIRHTETNKQQILSVKGIFIAIGHAPETSLFKNVIDSDAHGYLKTKAGTTQTNIAGVFAAGDVADPHYRQAVTAAGLGCMAALDSDRYLRSL